eukprot:3076865-Amphidinium_carterae.1
MSKATQSRNSAISQSDTECDAHHRNAVDNDESDSPFDMVSELAGPIVNRASQLWETIVLGFCNAPDPQCSDNTIGILGKLNVKLPMPTKFDGKNPQFREW